MKRLILFAIILSVLYSQQVFAQTCVTNDGHLVSPSKKVIEDSAEYAASGDYKAFQNLLNSGKAITIQGGMRVFVVDRTFTMIKFRPEGKNVTFWAQSNALNCR